MERNLLFREIGLIDGSFLWPWLSRAYKTGYEELNLQLGDSDKTKIYEGKTRKDIKEDVIKNLQNDLKALGIGIIGTPNGIYDFDTECSVREFQIYANMPQIAQQLQGASLVYGDTFIAIPNKDPYKGDIDGVTNREVRRLIQVWLQNSWRIPVIIQAWTIKNKQKHSIYQGYENIWKYNEVKSTAPRMYARDLSGYYNFPTNRDTNSVVVGDYATYGKWSGPSSESSNKSWDETEITPQNLLGKSISSLTTSEKSTFMVIRAVSNVECEGYFDRMNGYDNAFVSFGPFHWVLGIANQDSNKWKIDGGEIASYMAYLKEKNKATFDKAFGFFGIDIQPNWNGNGQDFLISGGIRNYGKGRPHIKRGSTWISMPKDSEGLAFGNYFRSWHWFYRFVMAARTIPDFTKYIWDFARFRIRDISNIYVNNMGFTDAIGNTIDPTLAQLFTSECAFALILRLHVRYPAHVANLNNQTKGLNTILKNSISQMKKEGLEIKKFSNWSTRHQEILIDHIVAYYPADSGIRKTLRRVKDFQFNQVALSTVHGSFNFHNVDLPPAPMY